MKELMKHVPAIKNFIEERTQALQEISDNMIKKFLTDAYKLPFLFPVRIIVSEEKFVNFLFDMRKDLFEGKQIASTAQETDKKTDIEPEVSQVKEEIKAKEETESITAKTTKAKNTTKVPKKTTESTSTKAVKLPTNSPKNKTSKTKKEKISV